MNAIQPVAAAAEIKATTRPGWIDESGELRSEFVPLNKRSGQITVAGAGESDFNAFLARMVTEEASSTAKPPIFQFLPLAAEKP